MIFVHTLRRENSALQPNEYNFLISNEDNLPTTSSTPPPTTSASPLPSVQERQATLGRVRRSFERGLLALIVDEDRQRGLVTLQHVARVLMEIQPPSQEHLEVVVQWLGAIRREQLQLSEDTFTLLRGLGQIIRTWELALVDAESEFQPDSEFQTLSASAQIILQQAGALAGEPVDAAAALQPNLEGAMDNPVGSGSEDHDFISVLQALTQSLGAMQLLLEEWRKNLEDPGKIAAITQGFKALRELSDDQRLGDVTEVTWAIENMLDRLVDGTLAVSIDFHFVANAAINFLVTLSEKLREISAGSSVSSFIDDYIYAEIIESADILASGGDLGSKNQAFEEDFPGEQGLDLAPFSNAEGQRYAAAAAGASADGLTLSLAQTIESFLAASRSLDEALAAQQSQNGVKDPGLSDEGLRLTHTLRQHLLDGTEVSDKLRGLLAASEPKSD